MEIARLILEYLRALVWPLVAILSLLAFKGEIRSILSRLKGAKVKGVELDFEGELEDAKRNRITVESEVRSTPQRGPSIPLTEANARLLSLGLRPSPSGLDLSRYRLLAAQDPNLALAGIRIEMEIAVQNLAKGFSVNIGEHDSVGVALRKLYGTGKLTQAQHMLSQSIVRLCNAALHGQRVSYESALEVIDFMDTLAEQYVAWLSWGFDDGWTPTTSKVSQ